MEIENNLLNEIVINQTLVSNNNLYQYIVLIFTFFNLIVMVFIAWYACKANRINLSTSRFHIIVEQIEIIRKAFDDIEFENSKGLCAIKVLLVNIYVENVLLSKNINIDDIRTELFLTISYNCKKLLGLTKDIFESDINKQQKQIIKRELNLIFEFYLMHIKEVSAQCNYIQSIRPELVEFNKVLDEIRTYINSI